ncbi:MAG: phage shock protein E [Polaribacter sp.]
MCGFGIGSSLVNIAQFELKYILKHHCHNKNISELQVFSILVIQLLNTQNTFLRLPRITMMIKTAAELIQQAQQEISCVDVASAKLLFDSADNAVIVDVREAESVAKGKVSQSINISRGLLEMKITQHCPDPDSIILLHCAGGGRASLSALTLQQMGYTQVYAITAPYDDIKAAFDS